MKKPNPYFTKGPTVLIKCNDGRFELTTGLPHGKIAQFIFEQKADENGNLTGPGFCEVPTHIYVVDDFKRKIVFHENYAQFLLNSYKSLEAIEAIEEAPVEPVDGSSKPIPVRKRRTKNETQ